MPVTDRDIRELRGQIDPRLGKILIEMNGDIHALRQLTGQLGMMMNKLADIMGTQQVLLENFKPHLVRMKAMGMEISNDPTVTGDKYD